MGFATEFTRTGGCDADKISYSLTGEWFGLSYAIDMAIEIEHLGSTVTSRTGL